MTKEEFIDTVNEIKKNKQDLCVAVTVPGQKSPEYIINKNKNIKNKLAYYCNNYDDDMQHKMNPAVKIVRVFGCDYYVVD